MHTSFADRFGAVELDKALPVLASSEEMLDLLSAQFGTDKAEHMADMMRHGVLSGDAGDELHDFLGDAICNDSEIVWSGLIKNPDDDDADVFPIQVKCYHGVYYVWAMESDPVGYFLSLDAAKAYAFVNWDNVVED